MIFARKRQTSIEPTQDDAAHLLVTPTALADLTLPDARAIVRFMVPRRVKAGTVFFREGEAAQTDYMMLVLRGEVLIEKEVSATDDTLVMSIAGPGSLIGEMGVLDGAPRSATCTASTDLSVAVLSREALLELMSKKSSVAARLLLAVSKRMSDRLREANRKIKTLAGLSRALQQELDVAHDTVGTYEDPADRETGFSETAYSETAYSEPS